MLLLFLPRQKQALLNWNRLFLLGLFRNNRYQPTPVPSRLQREVRGTAEVPTAVGKQPTKETIAEKKLLGVFKMGTEPEPNEKNAEETAEKDFYETMDKEDPYREKID